MELYGGMPKYRRSQRIQLLRQPVVVSNGPPFSPIRIRTHSIVDSLTLGAVHGIGWHYRARVHDTSSKEGLPLVAIVAVVQHHLI